MTMDLLAPLLLLAQAGMGPIIDVHRHASWPWSNDEKVLSEQLAKMDEGGVETAVVALNDYDLVAKWIDGAPGRFIGGVTPICPRNLAEPRYKCFPGTEGWADLKWLEGQIRAGKVRAIHEMSFNYYGIKASNPRAAPYWALAAKYDLPVGVHTQRGPGPGGQNSTRQDPGCCPDYDPDMGNPALLRPILDRHPGLRIWIQHVGSGRGDYQTFWPETLALLRDYPNVYLDVSITNGAMPVEQYEATLKRLIDAGFGDRIMFGSDNLPIAPILERMSSFGWLSEAQRRAILYDNAARFFRLKDAR